MRLRILPILLFAGVGLTAEGSAQQPAAAAVQGIPLTPGARVRVQATTLVAPLIANYLELRGDTLILYEESAARSVWSFTLSQVQRLETTIGERGSHRPYIIRGALYGAGAGVLAGVIFAASASPSNPDREYSRPLSALVGLGIGGAVGAFVGSRFTTEKWAPVPLPGRAALFPGWSGLSFRFVF